MKFNSTTAHTNLSTLSIPSPPEEKKKENVKKDSVLPNRVVIFNQARSFARKLYSGGFGNSPSTASSATSASDTPGLVIMPRSRPLTSFERNSYGQQASMLASLGSTGEPTQAFKDILEVFQKEISGRPIIRRGVGATPDLLVSPRIPTEIAKIANILYAGCKDAIPAGSDADREVKSVLKHAHSYLYARIKSSQPGGGSDISDAANAGKWTREHLRFSEDDLKTTGKADSKNIRGFA